MTRLRSRSEPMLQLLAAALSLLLYGALLIALKWWVYPGWTWRGFATDLKAGVGVVTFAAGFGLWLFRLYRVKTPEEALRDQIRQNLQSSALRPIVAGLLLALGALVGSILFIGERDVAARLLADAEQSNWKHAREDLAVFATQTLRPDLIATFTRFVDVHDLSERDQLKESRSLREDRVNVLELLQSGHDYHGLNALTFAELSKGLYFVEDAENPKHWLVEGLDMLMRQSERLRNPADKAALLLRAGELHLAGKEYARAQKFFEQALRLETRPVSLARIRANIGNTLAATGDTGAALRLYANAEPNYPEGRRAIFYSNYGYMSSNPDSRREARILAGRCLELAGSEPDRFLSLYLSAVGRSDTSASLHRLRVNPVALSDLYAELARSLERTNTHAIESYIRWFQTRSAELRADVYR